MCSFFLFFLMKASLKYHFSFWYLHFIPNMIVLEIRGLSLSTASLVIKFSNSYVFCVPLKLKQGRVEEDLERNIFRSGWFIVSNSVFVYIATTENYLSHNSTNRMETECPQSPECQDSRISGYSNP